MAKILLAEDDGSMCDFLTMALAREGHDVTARNDGLEALTELQSNTDYDLLLTDIVMPGMDGIELAQKAADLAPNLKVMFITGFAAVSMDSKQTQIGDTKVLSKPFHLKELVTQVDKILEVA